MADERHPSESSDSIAIDPQATIVTEEVSSETGADATNEEEASDTAELPVVSQQGKDFVAASVLDAAKRSDADRELVEVALRELEATEGTAERARLHHAIGGIFERRVGDVRRALYHYQQAYRLVPDDVASIRSARQIFWLRQNWTMVLTLIDAELRLVSQVSRATQLLLDKGRIYESWLINPEAAQEAYEAALERDPGDQQALLQLRRLLMRRRDRQGVLDISRHALSVTRDAASRSLLYADVARLQEEAGEIEAALESYSASFVEDPSNTSVAVALKRLYHRQQRWGDLIDVLLTEAEISSEAQRRSGCFLLAARICRDRLQQPDRALELINSAIRQLREANRKAAGDEEPEKGNPELIPLLTEVAELQQQIGRFAELVQVYQELLDSLDDVGERVAVHYRLGQLLEGRLEQETDALWHYRHAVALDPTYVPALQSLGRLYQRRGMWGDLVAMQAAEAEAQSDASSRADQFCAVADLCERKLEDDGRAIEYHRRALAVSPGFALAERSLERIYTKAGRWEDLFALLQEQLERSKGGRRREQVRRIAQLCEDRLGDPERAITFYEAAFEQDDAEQQPTPTPTPTTRDSLALQALFRLYRQTGRNEDLLRLLDAEAEHADDTEVSVSFAHQAAHLCEEQLGRPDEAIERYHQILERSPTHRGTLRSLGRLLQRRRQWDALLALYRREQDLVSSPTASALLLYKIGELQEEQLGDQEGALASYRAAVEAAKGFRPALQALARLHRARGEWELLIQCQERSVALVDDQRQQAVLWHRIGDLWEARLERHDNALQCYRRAFDLAGDFGPSRDALLRLLGIDGSATEEVEVLETALHHVVDDESRIVLLKQLGEVYDRRLLDPPSAIRCYEQVLALADQDVEALEALSRLLFQTTRHAQLMEVHVRLASAASGKEEAIDQLRQAISVIEVNLPDEDVSQLYERILELEKNSPSALEALARIYGARADHLSLLPVLERQLTLEKDESARLALLLRIADTAEGYGDLDAAADALEDAAKTRQDWLVVHRMRQLLCQQQLWEEEANAALLEADLSREKQHATDSLLRAAQLYREQVNDPDRMAWSLQRVLELEPFHEEAARRLEQLLVQRGDWERLVDVARLRLEAAQDGALKVVTPQIELLSRIAWIQREHLDQAAEAAQTLTHALQLDPCHLPTLRTLGELHVGLEQWQEAVEVFNRIVALSDDPELLRNAHFQLGEIWGEPLSDHREAISCFQNVLAVAPEDHEAMRRIYELFVWCRDWENAADIVARMIESERDPQREVTLYLDLADIYEKGFGDPQIAAEQLAHALGLDPLNDLVVGRLADLNARLGQWEAVCDTLRGYLGALPQNRRAAGRQRRLQLGEVLHQHLGRSGEALDIYVEAVEIDPSDTDARLAAALLYAQEGKIEQAIKEHRKILDINPLRFESLRQLRVIWSRIGAYEMAYAAGTVLVAFGAADELEQRTVREHHAKGKRMPQTPLDPALYESNVAGVTDDEGSRWAVLAVLSDAAHRIRPPQLDHWQVSRSDRLPQRSEDPLKVMAHEVRTVLGLPRDLDLYISSARSREIGLLFTDPPSLVAGSGLMSAYPSREIRFAVARLLSMLRHRCTIAHRLDARHLSVLVNGACRLVDPRHAVQMEYERDVSEMARLIQRGLNRRTRRVLEDACNRLTSERIPDFAQWVERIEIMALRAALWVVNDFEAAVGYLCRNTPEVDNDPTKLLSSPRCKRLLSQLLSYWLSDEFLAAKRAAA